MILDEAWRDLDRMAAALEQRAAELSADSAERAVLELVTGGKACPDSLHVSVNLRVC